MRSAIYLVSSDPTRPATQKKTHSVRVIWNRFGSKSDVFIEIFLGDTSNHAYEYPIEDEGGDEQVLAEHVSQPLDGLGNTRNHANEAPEQAL